MGFVIKIISFVVAHKNLSHINTIDSPSVRPNKRFEVSLHWHEFTCDRIDSFPPLKVVKYWVRDCFFSREILFGLNQFDISVKIQCFMSKYKKHSEENWLDIIWMLCQAPLGIITLYNLQFNPSIIQTFCKIYLIIFRQTLSCYKRIICMMRMW